MAPKLTAFIAILTTLSLLFFGNVHGCEPSCSSPAPPPPAVPTPAGATCPINTLDLQVCANLLGDLVTYKSKCCPLLSGLADINAALCACTTIKLSSLIVSINVNLLLNECGKTCPQGFTCPAY